MLCSFLRECHLQRVEILVELLEVFSDSSFSSSIWNKYLIPATKVMCKPWCRFCKLKNPKQQKHIHIWGVCSCFCNCYQQLSIGC